MKIPVADTLEIEPLWKQVERSLDNGDFTWLDDLLTSRNVSITDVLAANDAGQKYRDEALTWACFTGKDDDIRKLLDSGVDPAAGIATGLAGFHWAANRGNLEAVKILLERGAPLEQKNMYGGTVLGCALWSAVYEPRENHAEIIEQLVNAGAVIEDGSLTWWEAQPIASDETRVRVADVLARRGGGVT